MIKILILFSIVAWINLIVSQDTKTNRITCDMKTDENITKCITNDIGTLCSFSKPNIATCSNMTFILTNYVITKLPKALTDMCNNHNTNINCSYISVKANTILSLTGSLKVTTLKLLNTPINITKNEPLLDSTKMEHLELTNCSIHELYDETFSMLPNLTLLFLDNNALKELPKNIFKRNNNLETVYLQNNHLSTIPDGLFSNNSLLQKVYLQNNNLSEVLGELFKNNINLQEVHLENNNLSSLPDELFTRNTNLATVNLINNDLTEIVLYYNFKINTNLTVYILNKTMNIDTLCKDVTNFGEVKINFTDSVNPNCTMYEKVKNNSITNTTTNTSQNSTETELKKDEFKKYAWLYFFCVILFQLIILAILIVLYIRDKDDVSQKID